MKYLLDTNICVYLKNGDHIIERKVDEVLAKNCFISEVTLVELKFGAEYSPRRDENMRKVDLLLNSIGVIPISHAIDIYAHEQAMLKRSGKMMEKFDALIAATAILNDLTLVTNDYAFSRLTKLKIENWATHLAQKAKSLPAASQS